MFRNPLAVVCALAFAAGGAAALVLTDPSGDAAAVRGVAAESAHVVVAAPAAEAEPPAESHAEETGAAEENVETEKNARPAAFVRSRGAADRRVAEAPRAPRSYARVSGGRAAGGGGPGIAGRTFGGVKKTGAGVKKAGAAVGKTLGKIGGVFRE